MSIGGDLAAVLPDLRQLAESVMLDEGTLLRPSSAPPVLDPNTGAYTSPSPTELWSGPCWVGEFATGGPQETGGQQVTFANLLVKVPAAVTDVQPGDLFKVTVSRDPRLVGRTLTVQSVGGSSAGLQRQLSALDNQG